MTGYDGAKANTKKDKAAQDHGLKVWGVVVGVSGKRVVVTAGPARAILKDGPIFDS